MNMIENRLPARAGAPRRWASAVVAVAAACVLAGCGGGSDGAAGDGGSSSGADLATVDVTVSASADVDAEKDGGDALSGVAFGDPARAVCTTGQRVGVIPTDVDTSEVEAWTNATDEPVVFVDPDDVEGDASGLGSCSMGYDEDELDSTLLHGDHTHEAHAG
jgi:hypothetical protein